MATMPINYFYTPRPVPIPKQVDLPAGYYFPTNRRFLHGSQHPWIIFEPTGGVTNKGWFGTSEKTDGGIKITLDPHPSNPVILYMTSDGSASVPLPASFKYRFVKKSEFFGTEESPPSGRDER